MLSTQGGQQQPRLLRASGLRAMVFGRKRFILRSFRALSPKGGPQLNTEKRRVTAPRLFQWSLFPLVMGLAIWVSWRLMDQGMAPPLAILGPQFAAFAIVAVLEHVYPYHNSWNQSQADVGVDAAHALSIGVLIAAITPPVVAIGVALGGWLSGLLGLGLWPHHWPLPAQIALVLLVGELPGYWMHRLEHQWDGLWRFHAVHHSAPRLYWLNAGRFHPIDSFLTFAPAYLLLVMLGCGEMILAYFGLITAIHGIFQHANVQLRLGPLNWIFSMAELHRWHHSKTLEEANHNYGQTISVWDWVFGTRYLPADRLPSAQIGIDGLTAFPMTWWAQIKSPFRWQAIRQASLEDSVDRQAR
jgi:sterol desaturase/sphingolipid hydroxylase (fatty acid hydroxylase superfamily)